MRAGVLKEYLVSLGFSVDDSKYNAAMGKMKGFEAVAGKVAGNIGKNLAKGSAVAVAALTSVTAGVVAYMDNVTKADMETEKFARRMWMTEQNARSLQNTLKAMGEDMNSIYDVAANAELRNQFLMLRADAQKYEGGEEIDKAMQDIRAVNFEFQRFKLLLSYGSRYIGYYLTKYLGEPMDQIKQKMKSFNDSGEDQLNVWGERIAKWLSWVVRLFGAGVQAGIDLINTIRKLPVEVKMAAAALATIGMVVAAPWTGVLLAIGAVLLLLEDFYTWKNGGDSLFADMWTDLSAFQEKLANTKFESQALKDLNETIKSIMDNTEKLGDIFGKFDDKLSEVDGVKVVQGILTGIDGATMSIRNSIKMVTEGFGWIVDLGSEVFKHGLDFDAYDLGKLSSPFVAFGEALSHDIAMGKQHLSNIRLPAMATESARVTNQTSKNTEVQQDNSINLENHFTVNGSDAKTIALNTAHEMDFMLRRYQSGWPNGRINTTP